MKTTWLGFTMIELLITLALLAIIMAIAVPNYNRYVLKNHRAEGVAALNNLLLTQEKYRSNNATYGTNANILGGTTTTENGYFNLGITGISGTGFTATAAAQGTQANDSENATSCSTLTLIVNGLATTRTPAACWPN